MLTAALNSRWLNELMAAWMAKAPSSVIRQRVQLKLMHMLYRSLIAQDFAPCYQKGWPRTYLEREVKAAVFG